MRVLLVSPVDPKVPSKLKYLMGGENTYTRTLLSNPPLGIEYVHHLDAIEEGEIGYGPFHQLLSFLVKFRVLPLSAGTQDLEIIGDFDLVHCHAYTLRLSGKKAQGLPVVLGNSIPNRWGLSEYFKQSSWRINTTYFLREVLHRKLGIYDQDLFLGDFSKLVVMSEYAKREHEKLGADPDRIAVVYPGLQDKGKRLVGKDRIVRILFVGVWFERKGGMILWEAYKRVRERFGRKVKLTILGPLPKAIKHQTLNIKHYGIVQHDFVSYEKLTGEFYPKADIFVHVPPKSEGYGLVVQEAMSFGIPSIASGVGALPEMVENGKTGFLVEPGNVGSLEETLVRLIEDAPLRKRMGKAARKRFVEQFSLPLLQRKLTVIYKEALSGRVS